MHGLRGDTSIQQRLRYDLYYIENWSLWLDMKIIIMTFFGSKRRRRRMVPPAEPLAINEKQATPPAHAVGQNI